MARPHPHSRLRHLGTSSAEPEGIARLRAELAEKTRRAESTLLSLDNLVSPLDWADAGDGFPGFGAWRFDRPADRTMDRSHAPLTYLNEQEWRLQLALARDLCTRNHLALGFRDHVAAFVGPVHIAFVLRGAAPGSSAGGGASAQHPLVRATTQAWDEWREQAEWGEGEQDREDECRRRLIVEGECTLRFFQGDDRTAGLPYVRHVEPELIRTPPGHSTTDEWGWGFLADVDDDEHVTALWQCSPQNVSEGKQVPASEWVHVKANVDRTIKRGLSDFFAVGESLRKVTGLLDNLAHVARLQAAIAWWEQHPTATLSQVQSVIQAGADYARVKLPPTGRGASQSVTSYEAGTVVSTEAGRVVQPGPTSQPAGFATVEEMVLRAVGFRWGCPSYFAGAAQDSFASVLVTGSPFVRITEARQEKVKGFAKAVAMRVVAFCERSGRLPRGTSRRVRAVATCRPVVIADAEKQARTFLSLYAKNCADPVEFIRSRGGDPKVVAANIAAWQHQFAPPPGGGSSGPPPGPSDPPATPPGSAGGDGTRPAAEGRRVREGGSGEGKKEGDVWQGPSGRWFTLKGGHVVPAKAPNPAGAAKPSTAGAASTPASGGPKAKGTAAAPSGSTPPPGGGGSPPNPPPLPPAKSARLLPAEKTERSRIDKLFKSAPDPEQNPVGYLGRAKDKEWEKLQKPAKKGSVNAASVVRLSEHLTAAILGGRPEAANTGITDVPLKVKLADGEMDAAVDAKVAQLRPDGKVRVSINNADWIAKRKQARDQGKLYTTLVINPGFPSQTNGPKKNAGHERGRIVLQIGGGDVYFPKNGSAPTAPTNGSMIDLGPLPEKITDFVKDKKAIDDMRAKARTELGKRSRKEWEARVAGEQVAVHERIGETARPDEHLALARGMARNAAGIAAMRQALALIDGQPDGSQTTGSPP